MTDLRKAAEMALEDICGAKLCETNSMSSRAEMLRLMDKAAKALRQALAMENFSEVNQEIEEALKQPKREWVGLTDEEKAWCGAPTLQETVTRVEAKLREKNT